MNDQDETAENTYLFFSTYLRLDLIKNWHMQVAMNSE